MAKFLLYLTFLGLCCSSIYAIRCHKNTDCSSGFCDGGSVWRAGRCAAQVADGGRCLQNDAKSCASKQCTCFYCGRRLPGGYACSTNDNCASGWCHGSITIGCRGRCASKVADNQNCLGNNDANSCASRQCTCGKCGRKLRNGLACSTNDNCASGWCHGSVTLGCRGQCRAKIADGQFSPACSSRNDAKSCASGQCTCGFCGRKLPTNYRCSTNDNCRSGNCRGWFTVGCKGVCQ